jgi:uncharacterized membrane protein
MKFKLLNRIFASAVLLISAIQFIFTAQPSVSFWDPGEISAAAYALQVPHPPGGPLFSLIGHLLFMLPIPGNVGYRINLLSVFSSAFAVFFMYLCAVRLIGLYKKREPQDLMDALGTYVAAAIGALGFSFCDTFWFSGVESNMFAAATVLVALMTWLMLLWYEKPDAPGSWRYILMIAYLIGLSTGVHLMSVLVIVPVVMAIIYKRYVVDDKICKQSAYIFVGHAVILLGIALAMWSNETSTEPPSPDEWNKYDMNFIMIMAVVSAVYMGIFWKKVFNRNSFYSGVAFGGICLALAFAGIFKRLPLLLNTIAGDSATLGLIVLALMMGAVWYAVRWSQKNNKTVIAVACASVILVVLGFTTYTEVIIRSNQHPPMNENNPSTFTRLISYLGREQYGENPEFKRRWDGEAMHQPTWSNYSSDLDFFVRYQMNHMYTRYLLWNFAGRESFEQDAGVNWKQLWGIPLLFGLFGLYYHFKKDWHTASVFLALFIFMGYLIAFYPNAQEMQPRERDYFYAGSFFVFGIWIAIGIRGVLDLLKENLATPQQYTPALVLVLIFGIVFVPGNMFKTNLFTHDRSKNWLPWDFSYNLLQSCAPNALLITNGDNDTFPLWYLQDVEGVRRDIRIVNLSLVNTEWYIKQLKNETPYGTPKVKMSLTDEQIDRIQPVEWKPTTVNLPVPRDVIAKYGVTDTAVINHGVITFTVNPTLPIGGTNALRVQDIMTLEIIKQNTWQRPIYFASTCGPDTKLGLDNYLRIEGLAERLTPVKKPSGPGSRYYINDSLMKANLLEDPNGWSKTYKPGFIFRGLNDSTVFFNENEERMVQNYRQTFLILAIHYLYDEQDRTMALKTLDRLESAVPENVVHADYASLYNIASLYLELGEQTKSRSVAAHAEQALLDQLAQTDPSSQENDNLCSMLSDLYAKTNEYEKAAETLERLIDRYPNDPNLKNQIARYRAQAAQQSHPQPPTITH